MTPQTSRSKSDGCHNHLGPQPQEPLDHLPSARASVLTAPVHARARRARASERAACPGCPTLLGHLVHTLRGRAEKGSTLLLAQVDGEPGSVSSASARGGGTCGVSPQPRLVARPRAKGRFGRRSVDGRSLQVFSASLPTLQIRDFSFCAHPGAVGGEALCLVSLPVPGVLPLGSGRVQAASARALPGSAQQAWAFYPSFFPFPLAGWVLDRQCPPARAQLHKPAALMLLCSGSCSPWRCLPWLCSGPWGRSRQPSWPRSSWRCSRLAANSVGPTSCRAGSGMCPPASKLRS